MSIVLDGSAGITAPGVETFGNGTAVGGTTNPIVAMTGASTNYVQAYAVNNTNGTSSSADLVAYPSNGNDSHGWVDMGITSLAYADTTYTITGPNEAYLFGSGPTGTTGTGNLVIATDNTGTANRIQFYNGGFTQSKSATSATITQYGLGLGTAVASSGVGIAFPATQNPSSDVNTLDDYEEGTWTPTLVSSGYSFTYQYQNGWYVKIGQFVWCGGTIGVSAKSGSGSSSTSLSSLPFVATSGVNEVAALNIGYVTGFSTASPTSGYLPVGTASVTLQGVSVASGSQAILGSYIGATVYFDFSISYRCNG